MALGPTPSRWRQATSTIHARSAAGSPTGHGAFGVRRVAVLRPPHDARRAQVAFMTTVESIAPDASGAGRELTDAEIAQLLAPKRAWTRADVRRSIVVAAVSTVV